MTTMRTQWITLAAIAALATACTDPTMPDGALLPGGATADITQEVYDFPTPGFPILPGEVQLCKSVGDLDPGGTFNFTVTTNGTGTFPDATPTLVVPAGGETCVTVYRSLVPNSGVEQVVITEDAPPTGWTLVAIDTRQILASTIVNANGYTPPRLSDTENVGTRTSTLFINTDMARVVTFTNEFEASPPPPPPPPDGLGCTPGYWKQPHHFDSWPSPYLPGDSFNATFGIGTNWFSNSLTLAQALDLGGGQQNALARHAVAALLNAASGFNGFTTTQVIDAVQAAYANASLIESTKNSFADFNEQTCPLN